MNQNFYGKKLHSLFLWVFLFILAMFIPPVVASVASPPAIVQTQANPSQLVKQAQELYNQQQYESALPLWDEAAKEFAKMGDNLNSAIALSNLSLTNQKLGRWNAATTAIESSLKLLESESKDNSLVLAQTLDIQGKLQRETGKSAEAIETWQQAANIYQKLNNSTALTQSNLNQAQALQDLGLYPRACKRILSTLAFENISTCNQLNQLVTEELAAKLKSITSKPSLTTVSTLRNLGNLLLIIGQPQQSEQILTASLSSAQKLDSPQELSLTYLRLGNTYQALATGEEVRSTRRQYEQQALDAYKQVIRLSSSPTTKLKAQLNQLDFLIQQEEWSQAESLWKTIYPQVADSNLSLDREHIYAEINYAQNIIKVLAQADQTISKGLQLPSKAKIKQILVNATQQAQTLGDQRIEASAWGTLGKLEEITGVYPTAETQTKKALNLVSNYEASDIAYQYFWQLGRIQKKQERIPEAIAAYTKAYDALQYLRNDIATINPDLQYNFRDSVEPVYRELVDLLLRDKDPPISNLKLARDVIEALQLAELDNFFLDPCVDTNPEAVDQIVDNAIKPTAVIYGIILEDRLEVILKLPGKNNLENYSKKIHKEDLIRSLIELIDRLITRTSYPKRIQEISQNVYDWMIRPAEVKLQDSKIENLVFVLDGILRNIPMSVLYDKNKNEYLIEKYPIALSPGLQLLNSLTSEELRNSKPVLLATGLSKIPPYIKKGELDPLDYVQKELETIQDKVSKSEQLVDAKFNYKNLLYQLNVNQFNVIHFATHGDFSSDPDKSFIVAWDKKITIKDLDTILRVEKGNQSIPIELLIFSACRTAVGDERSVLGLAGIAVRAGTRSTLASLWSVADESTAEFMINFYDELINSKSINRAEALQQVQIKFLYEKKYRTKDWDLPYYWSSFILLGNWL